MASTDNDKLRKQLDFFKLECELRDDQAEKSHQEIEKLEKDLAGVLQDNGRLYAALETATVDRECYKKILIDQSLLDDAISIYKYRSEEASHRAGVAEGKVAILEKKYEDLAAVNAFNEQQLKIYNAERQRNGLSDVIGSVLAPAVNESSGESSAGSTASNHVREQPSPSLSNNIQASPSSYSSSAVSEKFIRKTSSHLAITQAAIGQFCGAYGFHIDNPNVLYNPGVLYKMKDASVQTGPEDGATRGAVQSGQFCEDWRSEKRNLERRVKEKDKKIDTLDERIMKKNNELRRQDKELATYKRNVESQNDHMGRLLKKLERMKKENERLKKANKEIHEKCKADQPDQRTMSTSTIDESISNSDQSERPSSNGSSINPSDVFPTKQPVERNKRKASSPSDDEDGGKKDLLGVKFRLNGNSGKKRIGSLGGFDKS